MPLFRHGFGSLIPIDLRLLHTLFTQNRAVCPSPPEAQVIENELDKFAGTQGKWWSKATWTASMGALRALFRPYMKLPVGHFTQTELDAAMERVRTTYSPGRVATTSAAYRMFRDWLGQEDGPVLPELPCKPRGRRSRDAREAAEAAAARAASIDGASGARGPTAEVYAAVQRLLLELQPAVTRVGFLGTRWTDLRAVRLAEVEQSDRLLEGDVLFPTSRRGHFRHLSNRGETGEALRVLMDYCRGEGARTPGDPSFYVRDVTGKLIPAGPLLPRFPGSKQSISLARLRRGLRSLEASAVAAEVDDDGAPAVEDGLLAAGVDEL
jgi:hypothetical protein